MKSKSIIVVLFLCVAAGLIYYMKAAKNGGAGGSAAGTPAPGGPAAGANPGSGGPRTALKVVFGTEKDDWMRAAVADFRTAHPSYDVELTAKGSREAAQDILDGKLQPTVFSPADSLVLNLLDADWRTKNGAPLVATDGDLAPQPLLLTPLVFVVWEDRAAALLKAGQGALTWKTVRKAVTSNRGWPAVGGKADWGFVKLGHTDPTRSNSGLQALWSMALEFYGPRGTVGVAELLRPDFQTYLGAIEKGVTRFEPSTGTFMVDMVRFGPSKYDMAVVYENLAIAHIGNAQGRWGNLHVYYPQATVWSDNPAAVLKGAWVTDAQRAAARELIAYLRSRPVQARALSFGFRPADPEVPIKSTDADNPLVRLAKYGLRTDVPSVGPTPDAEVVRNLTTLWSRTVANTPR